MASENGWFYLVNGQQKGPVSSKELVGLVRKGKLDLTDRVRREDSSDWLRVSQSKKLVAVAEEARISGLRKDDEKHANPRNGASVPPPLSEDRPADSMRDKQAIDKDKVSNSDFQISQGSPNPSHNPANVHKPSLIEAIKRVDQSTIIGGAVVFLLSTLCIWFGIAASNRSPAKFAINSSVIEAKFEKLGYKFENSSSVDGIPRRMGQKQLVVLELLGLGDELQRVSMLVGIPSDDDALFYENASHMVVLTQTMMPNWAGFSGWLQEQMSKYAKNPNHQGVIAQDGVMLSFQVPQKGSVLMVFSPVW